MVHSQFKIIPQYLLGPHYQHYAVSLQAMQYFTRYRQKTDADQIWFVEHYPIYTTRHNSLIRPFTTPTDRGGQITYHAPGQLLIYTLFDLQRRGWTCSYLLDQLESSLCALLEIYGIKAFTQKEMRGIYTSKGKIAFIGLSISRGCSYHGCALNLKMDLVPFSAIDPCGVKNMPITQMKDFGLSLSMQEIAKKYFQVFNERQVFA